MNAKQNLKQATDKIALMLREDARYADLTDSQIGQMAKDIVVDMARMIGDLATS